MDHDVGRDEEASAAWPGARHTLTRFVGRESETSDLAQLVSRSRLVTLVGAPGAGKTRLAAETSPLLAESFRDGVRPVALATVWAPGDVLTGIAAALGVRADDQESLLDALLAVLRPARTLLVLDNCEHVIGPVSTLVERILGAAPRVRVLATSRVPLGVPGEHLHRVGPLDRSEAYELFVDRARLVTDLDLDQVGASWVHRLCDLLDGLPLALELAARQTRVLSLPDLAERLDRELARTDDPGSPGPGRPTMEATLAGSCRMLSPAQNELFDQLSVFSGDFDGRHVEAVAAGLEDVVWEVGTLVDHSLLWTRSTGSGSLRCRMLEPIRQYAAARLAARGGADRVRERHARYFLAAARTASRGLMDVDGHHRYAALRSMETNVLAAVAWARRVDPDLALQLLTCLSGYWEHRGHVLEAWTRLEELLEDGSVSVRTRADALVALAQLSYRREQYRLAQRCTQELIPLMQELGDHDGLARGLRARAQACMAAGDHDAALASARGSVAAFRETEDRLGEAWSLTSLGACLIAAGRLEEGLEADLASWKILQSEPEAPTVARSTHVGLAFAYANLGDTAAHRRHLTASIEALQQVGALEGDSEWLWGAVSLAHDEGRWASALRMAALARAKGRRGSGLMPFAREFCDRATDDAERRVGAERAADLAEQGARMTTEQALEEALGRPEADASPLTPREREVARLTGQGLSNAEIAEQLVLSRRTVETHQDHIRQKLGLATRYEVMAWAMSGSV